MLHYSPRDKLAATRQFLRVGGHSTGADKQDLTIRGALALSYLFTSCAASQCVHVLERERMLHVVQQTSLTLHFLEITVRGEKKGPSCSHCSCLALPLQAPFTDDLKEAAGGKLSTAPPPPLAAAGW